VSNRYYSSNFLCRFDKDFYIQFHLEEVPYQPKKQSLSARAELKEDLPVNFADAYWNERLWKKFYSRVVQALNLLTLT
jgi:hypothetical protein